MNVRAICASLIVAAATLPVAAVPAQTPPHAMHAAAPVNAAHVVLSPATFASIARTSVTVDDGNGASATYSGVDLDALLVANGVPAGTAIGGAVLAAAVVVRASDGYRALFSLPELDPAFTDRHVLVADRRNGVPLDAKEGPYRLIVPAEKRHARWVHGVTSIDFVPG